MPRFVSVIDHNANRKQTFAPCEESRHDECIGSHRLPGTFGGTVQQVCACFCHRPVCGPGCMLHHGPPAE